MLSGKGRGEKVLEKVCGMSPGRTVGKKKRRENGKKNEALKYKALS